MIDGVVLLVEDNDADALIITEALEDAGPHWPGYRVRHVRDLRGAIDALEEEVPDCVLLDLGLPDATGVQAVDRLQLSHPTLAIVVLTGLAAPDAAAEALRHGAQDFLEKQADLDPDLLARSISHAIARAAAAQAVVESNRQLASFAAMVAHDLRSPLAIASGMLELLERRAGDDLDPELADLVRRSTGALRRTTDLVGALLMYARATRPDDIREPVDLAEVVAWAAGAVGAAVEVPDSLPWVVGDTGALGQVFQNLIANAVTYARPGWPPTITIEAESDHGVCRVTVTDDGPGIPREDREKVFVEGERLGRRGSGLGLGLPAVRATVQRYGGGVWIDEPPEGGGTRVVLTLPAADVAPS